jgi:hypothetical protein
MLTNLARPAVSEIAYLQSLAMACGPRFAFSLLGVDVEKETHARFWQVATSLVALLPCCLTSKCVAKPTVGQRNLVQNREN